MTLDPALEERIRSAAEPAEDGISIRLSPEQINAVCREIEAEVAKLAAEDRPPVVLVSPLVRPILKQLAASHLPQLVVLSHGEITRDTTIESVGMVSGGEWIRDRELRLAAADTAA